ncbi:MAG TPA: hypothetical protein VN864_00660 [Thermoplasmata archaeon]|nr:hypothetical protein [Thermoplasmata archaeon]
MPFANVSNGSYSVFARPTAGSGFNHWFVAGAVSVASTTDPYTTLDVTGTGIVLAVFDAVVNNNLKASVTFSSATAGATFSIAPGLAFSPTGANGSVENTSEISNGTTLHLSPGLYSVSAQPPSGSNFTEWATTGSVRLSTPTLPDAILDVGGNATSTVTATFTPSTATATLLIFGPDPADVLAFNGVNYSGFGFVTVPVGTYTLNDTPGPGARFASWGYGGSALMTNFSEKTWVTLEAGTSEVSPAEYADQSVTLNDSGGHGTIAWNTIGNATATAVGSGTTIVQNVTETGGPAVFGLVATPNAGWAFSSWTVSNGTVVNFSSRTSFAADAVFNTTGVTAVTITANFVAGGTVNGSLTVYPTGAGSVGLGFSSGRLTGGSGLTPNATFYVIEFPNPGFVVAGLTVTNGTASLLQRTSPTTRPWDPWVWLVTPSGPSSALNATFAPLLHPVTFVADTPAGGPTALLNGTSLAVGDTLWLPNGTYSLSVTLGTGVTFLNWTSAGALNVTSSGNATTTVTVDGSGTVYALGRLPAQPLLVSAVVSPTSATVVPGGRASFNVTIQCLGNASCPSGTTYVWSLLNSAAGTLNFTSTTSVTFTAAAVSASAVLTATATLNGTSVLSEAVPIDVVPALTGVSVNNGTTIPIYAGQTAILTARITCTDGLACPGGTTYLWTGGNASLGSVSPLSGSPTTYLSLPGVQGTAVVSVEATLGSLRANGTDDVAIALPILTTVTVAPGSVTTKVGADTNLTATPGCTAGLPCPAGTTYAWTVTPASLGALSNTIGASTELTAGTVNVTGWVNVTGTLRGVAVAAAAVAVSVQTTEGVLVGISVAPALSGLTVGAAQTFTATPACSPAPCPTGTVVSWALSGSVGTLSSSSGLTTTVTATVVGNATLFANATLNGKSASGSASVAVSGLGGGGGTGTTSTPLYDNPLLWIAVVVVLVVIVAAAILMRRKPAQPVEPWSPGGSGTAKPPSGST